MRQLVLALLCAAGSLAAQGAQPARYIDPMFTPTITSDILYGGNVNPWTNAWNNLHLDLWLPQGDTATKRPVFVYVHGGQYFYGDKTDGPPRLILDYLVTRGWVGVSINYRLAPTWNHGGMAPLAVAEDAKAAVRWVVKNAGNYGMDPSRIMMGGESVGAVTALICGYTSWDGYSGNPGYPSKIHSVIDFWGQGIYPVADPSCSLFIVHGDADVVVPFSEAQRLHNEALQYGVPDELVQLYGAGHTPWDRWDVFKGPFLRFTYDTFRLEELAGLDNRRAGNQVTWDLAGIPGDSAILLASWIQNSVTIPNLGTTWIDPFTCGVLHVAVMPPGAVPTTTNVTFPIPPGVSGLLHTQTLYGRNGVAHRLSNGLSTNL